jgi:hypothetical protein
MLLFVLQSSGDLLDPCRQSCYITVDENRINAQGSRYEQQKKRLSGLTAHIGALLRP